MSKLVVNSYEEFAAHLGEELGVSPWLEIDQERINLFADATLDHQWIHVDVERAKQESQFKSTIAHGYLTLSLLPHLWEQIIEVNNIKMLVNYGMDKMRFGQAVVTGSKVRLVTKLHAISNIRGICYVTGKTPNIKDSVFCPSYEEVKADKHKFAEAFKIQYEEQDPFYGKTIIQPSENRFVVQTPPAEPLTTAGMDGG